MLAMPSMWSLLISSIVFFVAAWYARRFLLEQDLEKGFTLNAVVITLATLASFASDGMMNWVEHKIAGDKTVVQVPIPAPIDAPDAQSAVKETVSE